MQLNSFSLNALVQMVFSNRKLSKIVVADVRKPGGFSSTSFKVYVMKIYFTAYFGTCQN